MENLGALVAFFASPVEQLDGRLQFIGVETRIGFSAHRVFFSHRDSCEDVSPRRRHNPCQQRAEMFILGFLLTGCIMSPQRGGGTDQSLLASNRGPFAGIGPQFSEPLNVGIIGKTQPVGERVEMAQGPLRGYPELGKGLLGSALGVIGLEVRKQPPQQLILVVAAPGIGDDLDLGRLADATDRDRMH